jgi:hypothetical protein
MIARLSLLDVGLLLLVGTTFLVVVGWWLMALFERESSGWRVVLWWAVIDIPLFLVWAGLALWLWER